MALNPEEINKVNDLYRQVDEKEITIKGLRDQLDTAQATINFMNTTLEEYKGLANNVGEKVKLLLDKVDNLEASNAKSTVKKATVKK